MRQVIAYPGTSGSFSHAAAMEAFPNADCVGYATFPEAAQAVIDHKASYAMLPVENSFAGAVLTTYQLLEKLPLHIVGEHKKRVRQQLLGVPGATVEGLKRISSHPQAIAQCDEFLSTLKGVQITPSVNTAISAREVAELGDPTYAAIASEEAAKTYGLEILRRDIQTNQHNTTRFVIVGLNQLPLGNPDKATVIFTVKNEVGSLVKVLQSFAASGLNMSRIESRPLLDSPFLYAFLADFEGLMDAAHLTVAMEDAAFYTQELHLAGVYARARMPE